MPRNSPATPRSRADGDARLTALATEIRQKLTVARRHGQATLAALMDAGDRLTEAKSVLAHGQWDGWLSENFELSDRTARLYMQLAEHRERVEAKMASVAILTVRGALEAIAEDEARQSYEQRNRELLAAELAKRGEWAKDPIGKRPAAVVQPALWPAAPAVWHSAAPAVWHSTDKLNAELVQRAVATIVLRIEAERADLAARGLEEQFDAELKAVLAAKSTAVLIRHSGSYTPKWPSRERWAEQRRCAYWDSNCPHPFTASRRLSLYG
jgi:Protein of unknown function (DUF3102)